MNRKKFMMPVLIFCINSPTESHANYKSLQAYLSIYINVSEPGSCECRNKNSALPLPILAESWLTAERVLTTGPCRVHPLHFVQNGYRIQYLVNKLLIQMAIFNEMS